MSPCQGLPRKGPPSSPSPAHHDRSPPVLSEAADSDTDLDNVLKDQSHASQGGDVGQRGEDGQHLEVLDECQHDEEGQDRQHVDADVQDRGQHQDLPGLAGVGDDVGFLHDLRESTVQRGAGGLQRAPSAIGISDNQQTNFSTNTSHSK